VLTPQLPWEGQFIQNFTCAVEPQPNGQWRLWYSANGPGLEFNIALAQGELGQPMTRQQAILSDGEPPDAPLSIGNLPKGWRPVQPVHIRLPNGRHRLYFWVHAPEVVRYLVAESDDGRRYRVLDPLRPVLWHLFDRAARRNVSGTEQSASHVDEPPADPACVCNDATNVYQLPDGTFELYTPALIQVGPDDPRYVAQDNCPGLLRVIDRLVSEDGLRWHSRQRIIMPDDADAVQLQFYHLSVTHTPQGRIGLLGHYRVDLQTMDLEWCFSSDGIHWNRPMRSGWLPRPTDGPDSWGIYPASSMVQRDGRWWLFYTGVNFAHNHEAGSARQQSVILAASIPQITRS
jgi:hypothetical protein